VETFAATSDDKAGYPIDFAAPAESHNVVSSLTDPHIPSHHLPVIDLDFEAHLEPSSTPGHHHLYLDRALSLEDYLKLLYVMAEVGLVEWGFYETAKARGYGTLRLPGVFKEGIPLPALIESLLS
jgi:hypothetical protein